MSRDDFSSITKQAMANRVGSLCSNPSCGVLTMGPNDNADKATSIGVAAHITAASKGGPRYNSEISTKERRSIDNGIWLCQNHAKEIDSDKKRYTVKILNKWKLQAEDRARNALGQKYLIEPKYLDSNLIVIVSKQARTTYSSANEIGGGRKQSKVTIRPMQAKEDLVGVPFLIVLGKNILPPKHNLWVVSYQNISEKVEEDVLLTVNFPRGIFKEIELNNSSRIELYEGSLRSSSIAKFHIKSILPKEKQSFKIISKKGYKPEVYCKLNFNKPAEDIYYYELIL